MSKNQKGFSAVEALLILVIAGIIGGVGWYVWNANQQTNKTLDTAVNISGAVNQREEDNTNKSAVPAAWKTYSSKTFGASFRYPENNWDIEEVMPCELNASSATGQECAVNINWSLYKQKYAPVIAIERLSKTINEVEKYYDTYFEQSPLSKVVKDSIKLNGKATIKYTVTNSDEVNLEYLVISKDKVFQIYGNYNPAAETPELKFDETFSNVVKSFEAIN